VLVLYDSSRELDENGRGHPAGLCRKRQGTRGFCTTRSWTTRTWPVVGTRRGGGSRRYLEKAGRKPPALSYKHDVELFHTAALQEHRVNGRTSARSVTRGTRRRPYKGGVRMEDPVPARIFLSTAASWEDLRCDLLGAIPMGVTWNKPQRGADNRGRTEGGGKGDDRVSQVPG